MVAFEPIELGNLKVCLILQNVLICIPWLFEHYEMNKLDKNVSVLFFIAREGSVMCAQLDTSIL